MVYLPSPVSVCKFVDRWDNMAFMLKSTDTSSQSRHHNRMCKNQKIPGSQIHLKIPDCHRSRSAAAAVDVLILFAVIGAFGFLLFPYIKFIFLQSAEIVETVSNLFWEELCEAPLIYASLGASISFAAAAAWGIVVCTGNKCQNPNCQGLRKAAEFDIQLATEECVKNSSVVVKDGVNKGLFELPCRHHRELEAELKKMAPPNGRAVLVFRARCGCSVGRLEVPGPRKKRKIRK